MKNVINKILGKKEVLYRNPLMIGDLRNEPCICSSGKKLKHCHGSKYTLTAKEADEVSDLINGALAMGRK